MKEQLISFETAKLAKEKGFVYMKANCYGDNMCYQLPEGELINALKGNSVGGYILAPTQSLLQKWLREIHNIFISTDVNYCYKIYHNDELFEESTDYHSYEEALEAGLYQALLLI